MLAAAWISGFLSDLQSEHRPESAIEIYDDWIKSKGEQSADPAGMATKLERVAGTETWISYCRLPVVYSCFAYVTDHVDL
jgi:hypothetical protein